MGYSYYEPSTKPRRRVTDEICQKIHIAKQSNPDVTWRELTSRFGYSHNTLCVAYNKWRRENKR